MVTCQQALEVDFVHREPSFQSILLPLLAVPPAPSATLAAETIGQIEARVRDNGQEGALAAAGLRPET